MQGMTKGPILCLICSLNGIMDGIATMAKMFTNRIYVLYAGMKLSVT